MAAKKVSQIGNQPLIALIALIMLSVVYAQPDPFAKEASCIESVRQSGLPASNLISMLDSARSETNPVVARETLMRINELCTDASQTQKKLSSVEEVIRSGESRWIDMHNSKAMLGLAKAAIHREDYTSALNRLNQAQTIAFVEASKTDWNYIITEYWWVGVSGAVLIAIALFFGFKYWRKITISKKIKKRIEEDIAVMGMIREANHEHYITKKLSNAAYHKAMYEYKRRQRIVRADLVRLRSIHARIFGRDSEAKSLQIEKKTIEDQIAASQKKHLMLKTMTESEYHPLIHDLHERLAEIEESLGVIAATKAKNRKWLLISKKNITSKKGENRS